MILWPVLNISDSVLWYGVRLPATVRVIKYSSLLLTAQFHLLLLNASHFRSTRTRGHNLPAMIKPLEIHRGVPHYLLLGTWEGDRSPRKGDAKSDFSNLTWMREG